MNNTLIVYKVLRKDYKDSNKANDYYNYPRYISDSRKRGIHFTYDPIEVFTWAERVCGESFYKSEAKYVLLEVNKNDIFFSFPNKNPAVLNCKVIREMKIDDILDYLNRSFDRNKYNPKIALKYIKENSIEHWRILLESKHKLNNEMKKILTKLEETTN